MTSALRNWAGNITFNAAEVARPKSVDELQETVRRSAKVRALGSGHSFNRIADTDGTLVSLGQLARRVEIDRSAHTVTVDGGATYADIAGVLHEAGYALGNVASLPHITVAGAVVTATHGSGDANKNLAAAVSGLTLVTAEGETRSFRRGDAAFDGAVVNLGALGIVSELTLDLVPSFRIRQNVYLDLPVPALLDAFDAMMARAYSVSLFTRWQGDLVDQVWIKAREEAGEPLREVLGARAADRAFHPIPDFDGSTSTVQMGQLGPWHERLFHFPVSQKASAGAEIQSELFVSRRDAPAAFAALKAVQDQFAPALFVSEVRSVAADDLWLSTAQGQDTIGFHFTWKPEWDATIAAIKVVEAALAPFRPRPHWAKVFTIAPEAVRPLYPRFADFQALAQELDPQGKFRNPMLQQLVFDVL
jgi:alditol oxidase